MPSVIIEPGTSLASSQSIVVANFAGTAISIYTPDGTPIPYGVVVYLERLTVAGIYQPVKTLEFGTIVLKHDINVLLLTTPGTYRVVRPDISQFGVDVGVQLD